jgi:predicted site-specific integrase-resolvase
MYHLRAAQEMLGISRSSLYKLIVLGRLHPIKIPGLRSRRIVLTDIEGLLNGAVDETASDHG